MRDARCGRYAHAQCLGGNRDAVASVTGVPVPQSGILSRGELREVHSRAHARMIGCEVGLVWDRGCPEGWKTGPTHSYWADNRKAQEDTKVPCVLDKRVLEEVLSPRRDNVVGPLRWGEFRSTWHCRGSLTGLEEGGSFKSV